MKVQVREATPSQLNWLVAKAMGMLAAGRVVVDFEYMSGESPVRWEPKLSTYYSSAYSPTTNWAHGGPIIERERISIEYMPGAGDAGLDVWVATRIEGPAVSEEQGPTPLIAAMRCYVACELGDEGDEVDVPEELK